MPIAVVNMSEAFRRSLFCLHCFRLTVPGRHVCDQRLEQMMSGMRDFVDRSIKSVLVCFRRFGETAQFSNELQRRRTNFVLGCWRTKVMKCFDCSAHAEPLTADAVVSKVESITRMKT